MTLHPADQERAKALFLDALYAHYGITTGLYTGLWQRYCIDLAEAARNAYAKGNTILVVP